MCSKSPCISLSIFLIVETRTLKTHYLGTAAREPQEMGTPAIQEWELKEDPRVSIGTPSEQVSDKAT